MKLGEEVYADFLADRDQRGASFEDWVLEHPDHSEELRRLHAESEALRAHASLFRGPKTRVDPSLDGPKSGLVVGDYELVEPIGEGGMGQVWKARQLSLGGRPVAVKFIRSELVTGYQLELFKREARAGGRLNHPGIVSIIDFGEKDGLAWIAMELVAGSATLRDALNALALEELPADYDVRVALLVAKVADAMQAAHEHSIIHRDLKPSNILIDDLDEPKIMDFGVARIVDEQSLSAVGDVSGTFFYMSPEQVAGKHVELDGRSDVFSLGAVLYEMLTLQRAFPGDTSQQIILQVLFKHPPHPSSIRSRVSAEMSAICGQALEKERDRRYASMAHFAADLRAYAEGRPIAARPPGPLERLRLWTRRNPTLSVAGALSLVALLVIGSLLVNRTLIAEAAALKSAEVMRLSALQDYGDLISRANTLWPPHPQNIRAYEDWISDAQQLTADLPDFVRKRDELGELRVPADPLESPGEEAAQLSLQVAQLRKRIAVARSTLKRRREPGELEPAELEPWELEPEELDLEPGDALRLADDLVRTHRRRFGSERRGLALATLALTRLGDEAPPERLQKARETVTRALFALGRDTEALAMLATAIGSAPLPEKLRLYGVQNEILQAGTDEALVQAEAEVETLETLLAALIERETALTQQPNRHFPESEEYARWWHANLTRLIEAIEQLQDPSTGLLSSSPDALQPGFGWSIPRRLTLATELRDQFAPEGAFAARWQSALEAIEAHPEYGGLRLTPQMGLVPIGPDPDSGLWEFWHVVSGSEPERTKSGQLVLTPEFGLVFVLVPGGTFWMGAQSTNPDGWNYVAGSSGATAQLADPNEGPVHAVTLTAYFLSKYELTQGQWERFTGENPSWQPAIQPNPGLHPVERVSWEDCMRELGHMGLTLPTEEQWERACRAGTQTPWWSGAQRDSLRVRQAANLADQAGSRAGANWAAIEDWPELDDNFAAHAAVGTFAANPFGFHEVHGNVQEWCLEGFDAYAYSHALVRSVAEPVELTERPCRGGSFSESARKARSAFRNVFGPDMESQDVGVRPARSVQR